MSNSATRSAILAHWRALVAMRGEPVVYRVGSLEVDLVAVKTRPIGGNFESAENIVTEYRAWDWLIDPNELINTNSQRIEPAAGHRIVASDGAEYRVQAGNNSDDTVWRWSESFKIWLRVHSEEVV